MKHWTFWKYKSKPSSWTMYLFVSPSSGTSFSHFAPKLVFFYMHILSNLKWKRLHSASQRLKICSIYLQTSECCPKTIMWGSHSGQMRMTRGKEESSDASDNSQPQNDWLRSWTTLSFLPSWLLALWSHTVNECMREISANKHYSEK